MTFQFGILAEIDIGVSTLALALTILFLTCFDIVTRLIEYSVRNNQIYNKMLQKMYKELMTMGFVTLLITLYTAADQSSVFARYSTEIDFMGYVTFFVAIFFVAHALYIMLLSMRTSQLYEYLHRIKVAKAIEIYTQSQLNSWQRFLFAFPYLPLSSVRQKLEFKIIHSLFRDSYWLPTHFDYGSYLSRSFEKYSLKMINIGWSSWVIMIVLGFLNYLRVEFLSSIDALSCTNLDNKNGNITDLRLLSNEKVASLDYYDSMNTVYLEDTSADSANFRFLEEVSHSCIQLNVIIFLISGSTVVIYAFILFITGRFYYQRLIQRTGISTLDDYLKFLMFEESISLKISSTLKQRKLEIEINDNVPKRSKRRMSINTLRKNVDVLLKEPQMEEEEKVFKKISVSIDKNLKRRRSVLKKTMSNVSKKVTPLVSMKPLRAFRSLKSFESINNFFADKADNKNIGKEKKEVPAPARRRNMIINIRNESKDGSDTNQNVDSLTSIEQFKLFKLKENYEKSIKQSEKENKGMMMSYLRSHNTTVNGNKSKKVNMKLSENLNDIYFFENPDLYFRAVEYAIMLNSVYLSLWVCNFISVVRSNFENSWIFQIVMLVPLLFVLPLLGEIVKVSSLLEAIAELDIDIIGAVLEEMEEKNILIEELRKRILSRIVGEMCDKKDIVRRLFQEIDIDHDGLISQSELRKMLTALRLHYSDAKFLRLYNAIDDDLNGSISELELTLLIFPDMIEDEDIKQRRAKLRQASQDIDETPSKGSKFRPGFLSILTKYAHVSPADSHPSRHASTLQAGAKKTSGAEDCKDANIELFQKIAALKESLPNDRESKDYSDSDDGDDNDDRDAENDIKKSDHKVSSPILSIIKSNESSRMFTSGVSDETASNDIHPLDVHKAQNKDKGKGKTSGGRERDMGRGRSTSAVETIEDVDLGMGNNASERHLSVGESGRFSRSSTLSGGGGDGSAHEDGVGRRMESLRLNIDRTQTTAQDNDLGVMHDFEE